MNTSYFSPLKDLLSARGMKQKDLAAATGLTEARVSDIARGLHPGADTASRIYAALELTEQEIASLGWSKEAARA